MTQPASHLDKARLNNLAEEIWKSAERLRGKFKAHEYQVVISKMVKNARLAPILNQYSQLAIGPEKLSSLEMGYIYEELLRRFSEAHAEAAGDHFTPREIIRLMVELLDIPIPTRHTSLYDPACGTYGMLYVAKEHLLDKATTDEERERVHKFLTLHGTELMAETYAIAQSEALIRGETQATVCWGNSLIPQSSRKLIHSYYKLVELKKRSRPKSPPSPPTASR